MSNEHTKQYADRDIMQLDEDGDYFATHMLAMTSEGLHSKADIAAELGYRDKRITELEQQIADASNDKAIYLRRAESSESDYKRVVERRKQLEHELEIERIRLAACGVVALANTPESAIKARAMLPEYESASCNDVARMVDKNMELEQRNAELVEFVNVVAEEVHCMRALEDSLEDDESVFSDLMLRVNKLADKCKGYPLAKHEGKQ